MVENTRFRPICHPNSHRTHPVASPGKATPNNGLVRVEDLPANLCSVQEGGVTPGTHTLLRSTVTTPNLGDGLYEFASCHGHFHFQHYATYRLLDATDKVWKAAKRGFCMLDTDPFNVNNGDGTWSYRNCGTTARDGFQGISDGWAERRMTTSTTRRASQ